MKKWLAILVMVALLAAGLVVLTPGRVTAQTTRHGGWADSIIWSLQSDGSQATAGMDAGTLDMWLYFYGTQATLSAAQQDPNIGLITVAGSTEDMLFNPAATNATAAGSIFNPFSVREVRTAMNYLIDRSYIAREIYGGAAFPMTAVESSQTPEYARNPVYRGDPTGGAWMAYTEGFASTALTTWPDTDPYYFYCGGNGEPFFSVNGGTYTPPAELADACNRLLAGQYVSVGTRQSLFQTAATQGVEDGVRVWLAAGATFPYAKKGIAPFVYDLAGATWSFFATRTAQKLD